MDDTLDTGVRHSRRAGTGITVVEPAVLDSILALYHDAWASGTRGLRPCYGFGPGPGGGGVGPVEPPGEMVCRAA